MWFAGTTPDMSLTTMQRSAETPARKSAEKSASESVGPTRVPRKMPKNCLGSAPLWKILQARGPEVFSRHFPRHSVWGRHLPKHSALFEVAQEEPPKEDFGTSLDGRQVRNNTPNAAQKQSGLWSTLVKVAQKRLKSTFFPGKSHL